MPFNALMVFYDKSVDFSLTFTPYEIPEIVMEKEPELSLNCEDGENIISISDFIKKNTHPNGDDVA